MQNAGYAESIGVQELEDGQWSWSAGVSNRGSRRGTTASRDEAWAEARRAVEELNRRSGR